MTDDAAREHLLTFIGSAPGQLVRTGQAGELAVVDSAGFTPAKAVLLVLEAHLLELRRLGVIDDQGFVTVARSVLTAGESLARPSPDELETSVDTLVPEWLKGASTLGIAREDWLATAARLAWRNASLHIRDHLLALSESVQRLAEAHLVTVMPAFSAGRPVQPTSLAHFLGGLVGPLATARSRFGEGYGRLNRSPLGAGMLAGDMLDADRDELAARLGFDAPVPHTLDAVAAVEDVIELLDTIIATLAPTGRFVDELNVWVRTDPTSFLIDEAWTERPEPAQPAFLTASRLEALARDVRSVMDVVDTLRRELRAQAYGPLGATHAWLLEQAPRIAGRVAASLAETGEFLAKGLIVNRAYLGNRAGRGFTTAGDLATFLMAEEQVPPVAARRIAALVLSRLQDANLEVGGITQDMIDSAALMVIGREIKVEMEALGRYLAPRRFLERRQVLGSPAPAMTRAWLAGAREALDEDRARLISTVERVRGAEDRLEAALAAAAEEQPES